MPVTATLPPIDAVDAEYLELRVEHFRALTNDDVVDQGAANAMMPDTKSLDGMVARLQRLQNTIDLRSNFYDKGMRILAMARKNRVDEEEERTRTDEDEREKKNRKKRKAPDSLAPQDTKPGAFLAPPIRLRRYFVGPSLKLDKHSLLSKQFPPANVIFFFFLFIERSSPLRESTKAKKHHREESVSSSLSPVAQASPTAMEVDEKAKADENEEESSSDDESRPPRPMLPQSNTFGDDPSTFPDPTVYEIRDVVPGMSEDEIKEIYSVVKYPKSDLANLIAGDPPDKDFSNAKPANQISFSTFSSYVEPYFRAFSEEDLAFLRERGDRVTPFTMPKRGKKHYTEIWAEEDGAMAIDSHSTRDRLPPNQPRGSIEIMGDDVGETDKLSVGPLLSRLLQAMRPEARAPPSEDRSNGVNGDAVMSLDMNGDTGDGGATGDDRASSLAPATSMPESSTEAWKKASHPKLEYGQVDERLKQELRHIGFLAPDGNFEAEYDGHFDDEVSARLRLLQERLREQMLINGARKARLTELVKERMAHQEYQTILEDLDLQVQSAYLKRTRTMGKSKKNKRPGGAGGGSHLVGAAGTARPGIGDLTRTLMERRRRWIDTIGSVFDDENLGKVPRNTESDSSIFQPPEMAGLIKKEKEQWDEEVDDEE
jgi:transcriptional adapter 3